MSIGTNFKCEPDSIMLTHKLVTPRGDSGMPRLWVERDSLYFELPAYQRVQVFAIDPLEFERKTLVDTMSEAGVHAVQIDDSVRASGRMLIRMHTDSMTLVLQTSDSSMVELPDSLSADADRSLYVSAVMDQLRRVERLPLEDRIDAAELDSLLTAGLSEAGIELEPAYGVFVGLVDSAYMLVPQEYADEVRASSLRANLFPHDFFAEPVELAVFFPDRTAYLWQQMGPLLAPTVVLMLIIVGCFVYTIRTIIAQRRLAGLLVDFINNMTHEFKTPISTIQLACEAIKRDDVLSERDKVRHFNDMILNENRRMKGQVDKILQMAVLEEGDYELKLEEVDMHRLIESAGEAVTLHVEGRDGSLECHLAADRHVISADPVHLGNVVCNLLDNANKYSPEKPTIRVATWNEDGELRVSVTDRGQGMKPEHLRQVFERYFRVPQGNVHDVKGFGLGLSYVKLMVEAHGGRVDIESSPGEGTRVVVAFPSSKLIR